VRIDDLVGKKETLTGFTKRFMMRIKENVFNAKSRKRGECDWDLVR